MKSEEKRKERATLTMNAWFPGGAIQSIIGKIDAPCGAAQHTDVWGVPRPDVDRVCDREQAFRHIQGGIQRRRNRIVERDGQQTPPPPEESVLHGPSEEWRLRLGAESCKFTKKAHTIVTFNLHVILVNSGFYM